MGSTSTLKKKFKVISKLGVGTYSKVYKVKRIPEGGIYALKKVKMPKLSEKGKLFILYTLLFKKKKMR